MSSKIFTVKTYVFIRTLYISIVVIKANLGGESGGNCQGVILRRSRRISLLRQRPEQHVAGWCEGPRGAPAGGPVGRQVGGVWNECGERQCAPLFYLPSPLLTNEGK